MGPTVMLPPLVGREAARKRLSAAVARMADGCCVVVDIAGEPGSGRTRLLAELARLARAATLVVYTGRATEAGRQVSYGMYRAAFESLLRRPDLDTLIGEALPEPVRYLRTARLAFAHGAPSGSVLLLDDVQWADPASLDLTEQLLRQPPPVPLLIALSYRTGRAPHRLTHALARHEPPVVRVPVPGLAAADLRRLLPDADPRRRDRILRATGGNPRHVHLLSTLDDDDLDELLAAQARPDRIRSDRVLGVLARIGADVAGLGPMLHAVAGAMAVAGECATVGDAARLTRLPPELALAAVDELRALAVLDLDGDRPRFRHPLVATAMRVTGLRMFHQVHAVPSVAR